MENNPFAKFAAGSINALKSDGWMKARKIGRDDSKIKEAARSAVEARKAKNRRYNSVRKNPKESRKSVKRKMANRGNAYNSASEESNYEEDDFIVKSDDEMTDAGRSAVEDEGDWNSDLEDDDESVLSSKKKKISSKKIKRSTGFSKIEMDNRTSHSLSGLKKKQRKLRLSVGSHEEKKIEEIEETPPPQRKKGMVNRQLLFFKDDAINGINDDSVDVVAVKKTHSKYFSSNKSTYDFKSVINAEEEKKEDDTAVIASLSHKNTKVKKSVRRVFDDSSSDESNDALSGNRNCNDVNELEFDESVKDTPVKSKNDPISNDDFVSDDDEALALAVAIEKSLKDSRKRLKKKTKSSLEILKTASSPRNVTMESKEIYLDDIEGDKNDDQSVADEDDGEISDSCEVFDEEERTAAQVLNEANSLSTKIVKVMCEWCGVRGQAKGLNKGLLLEEGALCLSGSGGHDCVELNHLGEDKNNIWISKETMAKVMPNVSLAEYQLLGVNWMALLNRLTFKKGEKKGKDGRLNVNGILADEMGLGKTVQTIAFLSWLNHQSSCHGPDLSKHEKNNKNFRGVNNIEPNLSSTRRPHLIIVPSSVLSNWINEFKKFAPHMVVVKYHGSQAERKMIQDDMSRFLPKDKTQLKNGVQEPLDIVLTTFSYFSTEKCEDRLFLRKFKFDYLVVDEGHTLKNPKGLRYRNLNKFNTSHRLVLTGTPVQNHPKELMSLLCFLMPLFDSKTKTKDFDDDDEKASDGGERMLEYFVHLEGGESGSDAAAYQKLKQLFAPFVLRRKKDDVLSQLLPPKKRRIDLVSMDEASSNIYNSILSNHIKNRTAAEGPIDVRLKSDVSVQKHLFSELRKAANHPLLLRSRFKNEKDIEDLALRLFSYRYFGNDSSCTLQLVRAELEKFSDYDVHCAALTMIEENPARKEYLEKYTLMEDDLFCSAKFVHLRTLLIDFVGKGHRILLFSQWTRILDLMHSLMESLEMKFLRLDGNTAVNDRQNLIDKFTNDVTIPVFLLSTRAGGMGLNLTAADVCILHDLDFNPFNDRQAEDRCHRIGQKKQVTIIKMVTQGTVDEDIYSLQERKEKMNEAIMEGGGGKKQMQGENEAICDIMNAAVDRFLKSPSKLKPASGHTENIISIDDL